MGNDQIKKHNDIIKKKVYITEGFWLAACEVSQLEYEQIMKDNPSVFKGDQLPVAGVTWPQAMEFCKRLTEYERSANQLLDGYIYTLPTEAQWEYACRAGVEKYAYWDLDAQVKYGNRTKPWNNVGQRVKANPWGLYNMLDNVSEWCLDWHANYPNLDSRIDPSGPLTGEKKISRGGTWYMQKSRPGKRFAYSPNKPEDKLLGFRICLSKEKK